MLLPLCSKPFIKKMPNQWHRLAVRLEVIVPDEQAVRGLSPMRRPLTDRAPKCAHDQLDNFDIYRPQCPTQPNHLTLRPLVVAAGSFALVRRFQIQGFGHGSEP